MRLLITGGTGVLGRAVRPLAEAASHELATTGHEELDPGTLVDAAIAAGTAVYIQPTVAFVYPPTGPVFEDTPVRDVPAVLRSAVAAEQQAERFARAGGRGVVLRLGLLDGPGTGEYPPLAGFGATLHVSDAGRALLYALSLPSGIFNVCRDGERVSAARFTHAAGWHPDR
jgi:nucleoside-diphosphate-sugar epimerase